MKPKTSGTFLRISETIFSQHSFTIFCPKLENKRSFSLRWKNIKQIKIQRRENIWYWLNFYFSIFIFCSFIAVKFAFISALSSSIDSQSRRKLRNRKIEFFPWKAWKLREHLSQLSLALRQYYYLLKSFSMFIQPENFPARIVFVVSMHLRCFFSPVRQCSLLCIFTWHCWRWKIAQVTGEIRSKAFIAARKIGFWNWPDWKHLSSFKLTFKLFHHR